MDGNGRRRRDNACLKKIKVTENLLLFEKKT